MSNDNRELDGKEICNDKKELTPEELEQVTGGLDLAHIKDKKIQALFAELR